MIDAFNFQFINFLKQILFYFLMIGPTLEWALGEATPPGGGAGMEM